MNGTISLASPGAPDAAGSSPDSCVRVGTEAPAKKTSRKSRSPAFRSSFHGLRPKQAVRSLLLLIIILMAGCDSGARVAPSAIMHAAGPRGTSGAETLRVKIDSGRGRVWVLSLEHIAVYDRGTTRLIRRIDLPPWNVARFICDPGLALDRTGAAFISHNLEPRIWRIDPNSFEVKEYALRLVGREHLDIGFGTLASAPDGTLFGVAATGGSVWRIDVSGTTAEPLHVDAPLLNECDGAATVRLAVR